MAKKRFRIRLRFFIFLSIFVALIAAVVFLLTNKTKTGQLRYGDVVSVMNLSGIIVRDETPVSVEAYAKVSFNVVEGEYVESGSKIATVYRRGYQDENMVTLLRLQRDIYQQQKALITVDIQNGLDRMEEEIRSLEDRIRAVNRGESDEDILALEQSLNKLLTDRIDYLRINVKADNNLNALYSDLSVQERSQANWTRVISNSAGSGIISFYFDGYEGVVNAGKLSMINAPLISTLVSANNTGNSNGTYMYRLVNNGRWYLAFATKATDPMRTVAGQQYDVVFDDYSDLVYRATATEPITSSDNVVNFLEFNTDIGEFVNIRAVKVTITKSAAGIIVDPELLSYDEGVPFITVQSRNQLYDVSVNVLAADEENAVIEPVNKSYNLTAGLQVYWEPEEEEDDD